MEQLSASALAEPVFQLAKMNKKDDLEWQGLLKHLAMFDVEGLPKNENKENKPNSELGVIHNQITRGTPTLASLFLERILETSFGFTEVIDGDILGNIKSSFKADLEQEVFEAFHLIDPRLKWQFNYNFDALGSGFEKDFLNQYLGKNSSHIKQLMLPQPELESLVEAEQAGHFQGRFADFAVVSPYQEEKTFTDANGNEEIYRATNGYVLEVDGIKHHRKQQVYDTIRDEAVKEGGWQPFRIRERQVQQNTNSFLNKIEQDSYIQQCKKNSQKSLEDDEWNNILQFVLTPIAVSRVQKTLIYYISNQIGNKSNIKIAILEHDVPCGGIALHDLMERWKNLLNLQGKQEVPVDIELDIYSNDEFYDSPLHHQTNYSVYSQDELKRNYHNYDLIIDHSILRRSQIEAKDRLDSSTQDFIRIRSSHFKKKSQSDQSFHSAPPIVYNPICNHKPNDVFVTIEDQAKLLRYFLQDIFRKLDFREGQLPILNKALQFESVVGLLPTGGGKSLTYQLASLLQPGFTMVIDPIKSLMRDQVTNLQKLGIDSAVEINSSLNFKEREKATSNLRNGKNLFCFISPERMVIQEFRDNLKQMTKGDGHYFTYFVIDEVHCVSEWGHDFRVPYLNLTKNALAFCETYYEKSIPIFGLTATASFDVMADIQRELFDSIGQSAEGDSIIRFENTIRNEIQNKVIPVNPQFENQNIQLNRAFNTSIIKGYKNFYDEKKRLKVSGSLLIKNEIGKAKIERLNKLFNQGELVSDFHSFNDKDSLNEISGKAFEEFLEDSDLEVLYDKWGKKFNSNYEELTENQHDRIRAYLKGVYQEENYKRVKLAFDDQILSNQGKNGAIIFCPHRRSYHGVTDRYKKDPRRDNEGNVLLNGVADQLEYGDLKVGTFVGSGEKSDEDADKAQLESAKNQELFVNDQLQVMVATKAFGMGMDKPHTRFTVHMNMPASIESFVQEGGRAGRDGKLAFNYILFNQQEFVCWDEKTKLNLFKILKDNDLLDEETRFLLKSNLTDNLQPGQAFLKSDFFEVIDNINSQNPQFPAKQIRDSITTYQVDSDNLLFFHYNAFRGEDQEIANVNEILEEITYPSISKARSLSEYVSEKIGFVVRLNFSEKYNNSLWVNDKDNRGVGFFRTDQSFEIHLWRNNGYEKAQAENVMNTVYGALTDLVPESSFAKIDDYLRGVTNTAEDGIGRWLSKAGTEEGQEGEFEIAYQNLYQFDDAKKNSDEYFPSLIFDFFHENYPDVSPSYNTLKSILSKSDELEEFLVRLENTNNSKLSYEKIREDGLYRKLANLFNIKRNEDETSKAIYRLFAIGVIDDYTIDYREKKFVLRVKKHSKNYYYTCYENFVQRYYSKQTVKTRLENAYKALEKSLNDFLKYLVSDIIHLIYQEIAQKRRRAIADMKEACEEGYNDGNLAMKSFIYLYFNSKYARSNYFVNGGDYSLISPKNQESNTKEGLELIWKFVDVIHYDGGQQDNLKHLRGATMRVIRSYPDQASPYWLKAFSLIILSEKNKRLLTEAEEDLNNGFDKFKQYNDYDYQVLKQGLKQFHAKVLENTDNQEINQWLSNYINKFILKEHSDWLHNFKQKFLKDYE